MKGQLFSNILRICAGSGPLEEEGADSELAGGWMLRWSPAVAPSSILLQAGSIDLHMARWGSLEEGATQTAGLILKTPNT